MEHVGRSKLCNALDTDVDASGLKLALIVNLESKGVEGEQYEKKARRVATVCRNEINYNWMGEEFG